MVGSAGVVVTVADDVAEEGLVSAGVHATAAVAQDVVDVLDAKGTEAVGVEAQVSAQQSQEGGVGGVAVGSPLAVEGQALGGGLHALPAADVVLEAVGVLLVLGELVQEQQCTSGLAVPAEASASSVLDSKVLLTDLIKVLLLASGRIQPGSAPGKLILEA